jgi:GTP-binding protein YchF
MLRAGLIGLSSSGKTTLFQLMTSAREAPRTHGKVEAHVGISKRVPATVEFADMAAGRGEATSLVDVTAYRNADALLHVVRAFRDPSVAHPRASIDPLRDIRLVEDELVLADLGVVERRLERVTRDLKKSASAEIRHEQETLERCRAALEAGQALRTLGLSGDDAHRLRGFQLLSAKPLLIVMNLDEVDVALAEDIGRWPGLAEVLTSTGAHATGICARIELEIAALEPADAAAFLADLGLTQPGIDRIIRAAYDLLGYISFFTVGEDECRAWSIPRETPAQVAAGAIHTDIQRGFIRAEVVAGERLLARGSLAACRDHGELRLEGKDYLVRDGDVINFRHAT